MPGRTRGLARAVRENYVHLTTRTDPGAREESSAKQTSLSVHPDGPGGSLEPSGRVMRILATRTDPGLTRVVSTRCIPPVTRMARGLAEIAGKRINPRPWSRTREIFGHNTPKMIYTNQPPSEFFKLGRSLGGYRWVPPRDSLTYPHGHQPCGPGTESRVGTQELQNNSLFDTPPAG